MANAIAPGLVPDDVRRQAHELLDFAVSILQRAVDARREVARVEAAHVILANSGQPPLPPDLNDPEAVRLFVWSEASGYSLARDVLMFCCDCLNPNGHPADIENNAERAAEVILAARRFLDPEAGW